MPDVNWWYQTPVKSIPKTAIFPQGERIYECDSPWSDCALLHAKIYYSDYGLLVSSSNFTASYFTGTEDTGFGLYLWRKWTTGVDKTRNV